MLLSCEALRWLFVPWFVLMFCGIVRHVKKTWCKHIYETNMQCIIQHFHWVNAIALQMCKNTLSTQQFLQNNATCSLSCLITWEAVSCINGCKWKSDQKRQILMYYVQKWLFNFHLCLNNKHTKSVELSHVSFLWLAYKGFVCVLHILPSVFLPHYLSLPPFLFLVSHPARSSKQSCTQMLKAHNALYCLVLTFEYLNGVF